MRKENEEEEVKSGKIEVEGRGEGVEIKKNGFALVCVPVSVFVKKVWRWVFVPGDVVECVLVRVFDLTASSASESAILSVSFSVSQFNMVVSQTLSLSEKRGACGTLLCVPSRRAKKEHGRTTSQSCIRSGD